MECPKCKSKRFIKNGVVPQRNNFTRSYQGKKPPMIKLSRGMPLALACVLYLNGLGFRRIGAILSEGMPLAKVNHSSVIRWVKQYGEEIEKTFPVDKTKKHCKVIEIDEMWHYVEKKTKIVDLDCFCQGHPLGGQRNKRDTSV